MSIDGLYISGYFSDDDNPMLSAYADKLKEKGLRLYVRNLSGTMMQVMFETLFSAYFTYYNAKFK